MSKKFNGSIFSKLHFENIEDKPKFLTLREQMQFSFPSQDFTDRYNTLNPQWVYVYVKPNSLMGGGLGMSQTMRYQNIDSNTIVLCAPLTDGFYIGDSATNAQPWSAEDLINVLSVEDITVPMQSGASARYYSSNVMNANESIICASLFPFVLSIKLSTIPPFSRSILSDNYRGIFWDLTDSGIFLNLAAVPNDGKMPMNALIGRDFFRAPNGSLGFRPQDQSGELLDVSLLSPSNRFTSGTPTLNMWRVQPGINSVQIFRNLPNQNQPTWVGAGFLVNAYRGVNWDFNDGISTIFLIREDGARIPITEFSAANFNQTWYIDGTTLNQITPNTGGTTGLVWNNACGIMAMSDAEFYVVNELLEWYILKTIQEQ